MKTKNKILVLIVPILIVSAVISYWFYTNKAYYPTLPFQGGSKKEVVQKLEKSSNELVQLAKVNGSYWLGFKGSQQEGRESVIKEMEERGLKYDSYDGNGIFFKNDKRIIISGTKWTGDYVLYKVPAESNISK